MVRHHNEAIMARQTSWATIDFEAQDAVYPEYMFDYGGIDGEGLDMGELRPVVIAAQAAMKAGYGAAFESARGKPGAAPVYERGSPRCPRRAARCSSRAARSSTSSGCTRARSARSASCGRTGSGRSPRAARRAWPRRGASRRCAHLAPALLCPRPQL